jgi:hypothetical protein
VGLGTPVYAVRVETRQITQVITSGYNVPDIRLRALTTDEVPRAEVPLVPINDNSQTNFETVVAVDFSILSLQQDPQKGIQPTVETTVCDCADLMIPVAGEFPKWPLLFLAGIPLLFIKGGEEELPPIVTPTPPLIPTPNSVPTPTPTPEPTSLLLLLSGVCAVGLRLRKSKHGGDEKTDDV